jgi:hypothetical protein
MKTILETNDPILLGLAQSVLEGAGIGCVLLDHHAAALYGGSGVIVQRLCVLDEDEAEACDLVEALKTRPFADE